MREVIIIILCAAYANAFTATLTAHRFRSQLRSAESSEDARVLKMMLSEVATPTKNGLTATDEQRSEISSIISTLEQLNPTKELTTSPVLNGNWRLLYTTNSGSSAGKIGPFVGKVTQVVNTNGPSYTNAVDVLPFVRAELEATWEVDAFAYDTKWTVIFRSLAFKIFGLSVLKKELKQEGFWKMSYLDDEMRVLWAKGGKNLNKENVYVLVRGS